MDLDDDPRVRYIRSTAEACLDAEESLFQASITDEGAASQLKKFLDGGKCMQICFQGHPCVCSSCVGAGAAFDAFAHLSAKRSASNPFVCLGDAYSCRCYRTPAVPS